MDPNKIVTLLDGRKVAYKDVPNNSIYINDQGQKFCKIIKVVTKTFAAPKPQQQSGIGGFFSRLAKGATDTISSVTDSFDVDKIKENWDKYIQSYNGNNAFDIIKSDAKMAGTEVTYRSLLLYEASKLPNLTILQQSVIKGALGYRMNPYDLISDSIKGVGYWDDLKVLEMSCNGVADIISKDIKNNAVNELKSLLQDFKKEKIQEIDNSIVKAAESIEKTKETVDKAVDATIYGAKVVSGIQAYQDRQEVQDLNKQAEEIKKNVEEHTEELRISLNKGLEELGEIRLNALHNTVGKFIACLKKLNQSTKSKEYEFLKELSVDPGHIKEMEELDMKASDALKVLSVGGGFASVGIMATPWLVTHGVMAIGAASTGTAISSLSGAAATNAIMAWLGGGSIAAGGGGVAAGAAVLTTITAGVAVGAAIVSIGVLASSFYSRKLTEATQYLAAVQEWEAKIKQSWVALEAMLRRIKEIKDVTKQLEIRAAEQMGILEYIIPSFDNKNKEHVKIFQQAAILVKSMSELAQVSLLDQDGNLTEESNIVATKTQKLLNSEL